MYRQFSIRDMLVLDKSATCCCFKGKRETLSENFTWTVQICKHEQRTLSSTSLSNRFEMVVHPTVWYNFCKASSGVKIHSVFGIVVFPKTHEKMGNHHVATKYPFHSMPHQWYFHRLPVFQWILIPPVPGIELVTTFCCWLEDKRKVGEKQLTWFDCSDRIVLETCH